MLKAASTPSEPGACVAVVVAVFFGAGVCERFVFVVRGRSVVVVDEFEF